MTPLAGAATATASLVDGAFLLADTMLSPGRKRDVINSVVCARRAGAKSNPAERPYGTTLGNIGWVGSRENSSAVDLKPQPHKNKVPLEVVLDSLGTLLSEELAKLLTAKISSLGGKSADIRAAWAQAAASDASDPQARCSSLFVATADPDGTPSLVYNHNELAPANPSDGYPWSALTKPGRLTQYWGQATMDPTIFTPDFSSQLNARVASLNVAIRQL